MRFGLVENGALEFTLALGLGGCLAIYRRSDIERCGEVPIEAAHGQVSKIFHFLLFYTPSDDM